MILEGKKIDLKNQIDCLKSGLEKFRAANKAVKVMEIELKEIQPIHWNYKDVGERSLLEFLHLNLQLKD